MDDFEYARDRIIMGIERKKLNVSDKERINTAIHEAGHAIACYFSQTTKLYKATIVSRGQSLGAVSFLLIIAFLTLDFRRIWCLTTRIRPPGKRCLTRSTLQWVDT